MKMYATFLNREKGYTNAAGPDKDTATGALTQMP